MAPQFGYQKLSGTAIDPLLQAPCMELDIHPLLEVSADVGAGPEDVRARFCAALVATTHGRAHLHLLQSATLHTMATFPFAVPVTFQTHRYGILAITADPDQPTKPALNLLTATTLACLCGCLWHGIEQRYILRSLMRHVPIAPLAPFTPTEQQIASLLARGLDEDEIAGVLSRSVKTVAKHCEHIRQKLGVHSHADMLLSMYANHLVSVLDQPVAPPRHAKPRTAR